MKTNPSSPRSYLKLLPPCTQRDVISFVEEHEGLVYTARIKGKGCVHLHVYEPTWRWADGTPVLYGCPRRDRQVSERDCRAHKRQLRKERKAGEERKKGHDEVAPTDDPQGDGDLHGGDGNSGECDNASETSAPDRKGQDNTSADQHSPAPSEEGSPSEEGEFAAPGGGGGKEDQNGQPEPGDGNPTSDADGAEQGAKGVGEGSGEESDKPNVVPSVCSGGSSSPTEENLTAQSPAGEEQSTGGGVHGEGPTAPRPSSSGVDEGVEAEAKAEAEDAEKAEQGDDALRSAVSSPGGDYLRPTDPTAVSRLSRDAGRIRRLLLRLIEASDQCGDETSPRWSARKLVTELATKRYALGRARRTELQPPRYVLAVDVSGSCAGLCGEVWMAAKAILHQDPRVILVKHSNGFLFQEEGAIVTHGSLPTLPCGRGDKPTLQNLVEGLQRTEQVRLLVNFGDLDAEDALLGAAKSGAMVVHLDNYLSRHGELCLMKKLPLPLKEAGVIAYQGVGAALLQVEWALKGVLKVTRKG